MSKCHVSNMGKFVMKSELFHFFKPFSVELCVFPFYLILIFLVSFHPVVIVIPGEYMVFFFYCAADITHF